MKQPDLLDRIRVASPCDQSWDSMAGNDEVRFCDHCSLHVHDLSSMTRARALALVAASNGSLCVRYEARPDGGVRTKPAAPYAIARRASRAAAGALSATLAVAGVPAPVTAQDATKPSAAAVAGPDAGARMRRDDADTVPASLSGRVVEAESDVSIRGAVVTLTNRTTCEAVTVVTSEAGAFCFDGVASGVYSLDVTASEFGTSYVPITIAGQSNATHTVSLVRMSQRVMTELPLEGRSPLMGGMVIGPAPTPRSLRSDDKRAEPNTNDASGATPLMRAQSDRNAKATRRLLDAGADVNVRDEKGRTALMYAAKNGRAQQVKLLLAAGADARARDTDGKTALGYAIASGGDAVVELLRKAGAAE